MFSPINTFRERYDDLFVVNRTDQSGNDKLYKLRKYDIVGVNV